MPRELIEPQKGDKRYVRRKKTGKFTKSQDNLVLPSGNEGLIWLSR